MTHLTPESILAGLGAISFLCGLLSHVIPGRAGALFGEIGVDIAGFVKVVQAPKEKP
jgi:hypothetical protein